jgi:hypothetical protein
MGTEVSATLVARNTLRRPSRDGRTAETLLLAAETALEEARRQREAEEARKREEAWARIEHRAKEWIVTVQDAIDLGSKDERALLEPLRTYVDARINHVWALYDSNLTMSDLARATGWDAAAPATE